MCLRTWLSGHQTQVPMLAQWTLKTDPSPQAPRMWISGVSVASSVLFLSHGSPLCSLPGHTSVSTYAYSALQVQWISLRLFVSILYYRETAILFASDGNVLLCAGEALHCLISKSFGDSTLGLVRERRLPSGNGINGKWSDAFKTIFSCLTLILPPHASSLSCGQRRTVSIAFVAGLQGGARRQGYLVWCFEWQRSVACNDMRYSKKKKSICGLKVHLNVTEIILKNAKKPHSVQF